MKKLLAVLLLSASAFAQTKESLEQRVSPKPSGTAGDIPYAVNTTTIGWIPHATGLKCLTQNGTATPVWAACTSGASPLTTKGDIYVYSTVDDRLPVGTNGYVLESDSTQATGLKWVDPNVSSTGWVKLQASYPGSQQTGSFNVSGAAGSGPYTVVYTTVSGSPGTYDLFRGFYGGIGVVGDRYRMLLGSESDTAKQLALSYYNPSSGGGEQPSWTFHAVSLSEGNGVTLFKKGSLTQLCVDTDGTSGSGYPTICNGGDAFNVGYVSGAGPALQINGTGDLVKIRNVVYSWPTSAPAAATCARRDAAGNITWDTACGTGTTGFSAQTANTVFAGPTNGGPATPAFRALVSADIPNNAADTTGKSATTDALNTTTTAVNVSLSAAPGGAGYACITTDATHCTWQTVAAGGTVSSIATTAPITGGTITTTGTIGITSFATTAPSPGAVPDATAAAANTFLKKDGTWSTPTGTGGVTVATKGDIQTYDTNPANLAVGITGQVLSADSSTATGLKWKADSSLGTGVWTWAAPTRTTGTVYQNTSSFPMLIISLCSSTGAGNCEVFSDAANPPTTSRGKTSNSNTGGINTYIWVLPSHYYKIVATTATVFATTEYTFLRGTLTDSGDLSGSRAFTTVYQNTSGKTRFVEIEVGTSGSATALSDTSNPPTTTVMAAGINSGVGVTLMFPVLDNHYYKVTQGGAATIVKWYEYDLSGVTVTRSSSVAARPLQGVATPTRSFQNYSGKSVLVFMSGHAAGTSSLDMIGQPQLGFTAEQGSLPLTYICFYTATSGIIRPIVGGINPGESYTIYFDAAGTLTTDSYFEFTLE